MGILDRILSQEATKKKLPTSFNNYFVSWFTGTSICTVKHPTQGGHKVLPEQIKLASGEYKSKVFKNIMKYYKDGTITDEMIAQHSKKP